MGVSDGRGSTILWLFSFGCRFKSNCRMSVSDARGSMILLVVFFWLLIQVESWWHSSVVRFLSRGSVTMVFVSGFDHVWCNPDGLSPTSKWMKVKIEGNVGCAIVYSFYSLIPLLWNFWWPVLWVGAISFADPESRREIPIPPWWDPRSFNFSPTGVFAAPRRLVLAVA
jgi:hypothetical protein